MRRSLLLAPITSVALVSPARAQGEAPKPDKPKEEKVCRQISDGVSRYTKRVCKSPAEWAARQTSAQDLRDRAGGSAN